MTAIRKVDLTTAKKTDENTLFPALPLPNTGHAIFSPQGDDTHGASLFRTRKPVMSLHTTQAHEAQKSATMTHPDVSLLLRDESRQHVTTPRHPASAHPSFHALSSATPPRRLHLIRITTTTTTTTTILNSLIFNNY